MYQENVINRVINSKKRIIVVHAPTGSGKTIIGLCTGTWYKGCTYIVHSKSLQEQIITDFPEAKLLKGKSNYPCILKKLPTSEECLHGPLFKCPVKHKCIYEIEKEKTLNSPYKILNYAYWFNEANYIGKFSGASLLVLDEADLLEGILSNWITLNISENRLSRLGINMPKYKTSRGLKEWISWGMDTATPAVKDKLDKVIQQASQSNMFKDAQLEEYNREIKDLQGLQASLEKFCKYVDTDWLMETRETRWGKQYSFKPLYPPIKATEDYLLRHADKILLLSATLPPPIILSSLTGIPSGDMETIEVPSSFPSENRKVITWPVANITHKTMDIEAPKLIQAIEHIINLHPNEKGLIHSVSYKLADMIKPISSRIITHHGANRQEILEEFQKSHNPLILLSPSMERGVNLPEDQCRFVIWAKCPYESLGDKLVSSRLYGSPIGPFWYKSLAAQSIIQGSGRGIRSHEDTCTIYLLDSQIDKLISDHPTLFPAWWRESLEL